jgi:biotin operon repressor
MRSLLLKPTNARWAERTTEMTKSIETIRASLANDLVDAEAAIRADEREKATQEATRIWRGYVAELEASYAQRDKEWGEKLLRIFEDRSGEDTSREQAEKPAANNWYRMAPRHHVLVEELKRGFTSVPSLAGNMGLDKQTIYSMLTTLKKNGYNVEIKSTGYRRAGRYRKIYRLAS